MIWGHSSETTIVTYAHPAAAPWVPAAAPRAQQAQAVLQAVQQSQYAGKSHYGYTLASSASSSGSASTTVSSAGNNVNITLTIDKASDAEAIAFAIFDS